MTDIAGIINGINQVTQVVGAVNGAVNVLAPTLQTVHGAVNNIANTINPGYTQDYMQQPMMNYYPPGYMPANSMQTLSTSPSDSSPIGTIGSALAGGVAGALKGRQVAASKAADAISTETGIASKLSGGKTMITSGLKAGGIGAAIGGLFSGIQNIMKLNKNEITGSEATGNIVADTTVGFFSGIGGLATGSLAAMAMGGLGSLPLTIGAAAAGLVGAVGVDLLFRKTGLRQTIADGVRNMVG
jgi:hypothetical protein